MLLELLRLGQGGQNRSGGDSPLLDSSDHVQVDIEGALQVDRVQAGDQGAGSPLPLPTVRSGT